MSKNPQPNAESYPETINFDESGDIDVDYKSFAFDPTDWYLIKVPVLAFKTVTKFPQSTKTKYFKSWLTQRLFGIIDKINGELQIIELSGPNLKIIFELLK